MPENRNAGTSEQLQIVDQSKSCGMSNSSEANFGAPPYKDIHKTRSQRLTSSLKLKSAGRIAARRLED
jgi:hypothetical protein